MENPPAALISSGRHRTRRKQGEGADLESMNQEGGNQQNPGPQRPSLLRGSRPTEKQGCQARLRGLRSPPELWCSAQGQGHPRGGLTVGPSPSAPYSVVWSGPESVGGGQVCRCWGQPSFFTFTVSVHVHTCHDTHVEARRKLLMVALSFHLPRNVGSGY